MNIQCLVYQTHSILLYKISFSFSHTTVILTRTVTLRIKSIFLFIGNLVLHVTVENNLGSINHSKLDTSPRTTLFCVKSENDFGFTFISAKESSFRMVYCIWFKVMDVTKTSEFVLENQSMDGINAMHGINYNVLLIWILNNLSLLQIWEAAVLDLRFTKKGLHGRCFPVNYREYFRLTFI